MKVLLIAVLASVAVAAFDVPQAEACHRGGGRGVRVERRQDRRAERQDRRHEGRSFIFYRSCR